MTEAILNADAIVYICLIPLIFQMWMYDRMTNTYS